MLTTEQLQEKWKPVLEFDGVAPITDTYRKSVTAQLLENQEQATKEQAVINGSGSIFLSEAGVPASTTGSTAGGVGGFNA